MADITDIERLNYYEGEYLGALDFEAEQEYHRDMRRRHNIGPHTWGIITGLDVAQFLNSGPNNEVDVYIQPGVAVDGFGREIVVLSPYQLTTDLFSDFPSKQTLTVWIGYSQQMINPDSDTCASAGQTNAYSRVQESFQIVIDPIPPTSDPAVVAGNDVTPPSTKGWTQPAVLPPLPANEGDVVIALDDSVPFQALPDDGTTANWLVPLGRVLWDAPNQRFLQSAQATANLGRQYGGSVAANVYAPAGVLTIQDRSTPSPWSPSYTGVAVEVQGTLTVDAQLTAQADVWINGGDLYFKDAGGSDGDTVLYLERINGSSGGADLHIHIGDNSDPTSKPQGLTVGYGASGSKSDTNVFTVSADGDVDIPSGSLSFGSQQAQILNLSGTKYGIGVQTDTLYFRSASDFAFYVDGKYSATQDDPGSGGVVSLLMDSAGDVTISGALAIDDANDNDAKVNPGLTFGHASGEGIASKRTKGGNKNGLDFYTAFGVRMSITNGGDVGIGTTSPSAPLQVVSAGNHQVANFAGPDGISDGYLIINQGDSGGNAILGSTSAVGFVGSQGNTPFTVRVNNSPTTTFSTNGNVGIGTTSPSAPLQVVSATNHQVANFAGPSGISDGYLLVNQGDSGGNAILGSTNALGFVGSQGNTPFTVRVNNSAIATFSTNGNLSVKGNISAGGSKSGYVVDRFFSRAKKPLARGDVVVLHTKPSTIYYGVESRIPIIEVALASKAGDPRVCGIVDEPALTQDETPDLDGKQRGNGNIGLMVTLGAYAYCKVNADFAPIQAGDLLTTSSTLGHAQKLDPELVLATGCVIGKALGSLEKGKGTIPVLISHQ